MNSHQNGTRNSDIATPHLEAAYMKHKKFGKLKKPTLNDPDDPVFLAQSFSSSEPRQQHQPISPNIEIKKESNHNDNEIIKSEPEQETDEEIANEIPEKCQIGFSRPVLVETTGGGSSSLIKETNNKLNKIWRPCDSTHSTNTGSSNGAFRPVVPMVQRAPHPPPPPPPPVAPQVTPVFSANLARCSRCKEIFKLHDIVRHLREQHGSIQEDYEIIKTLPSGASLELVPPPPPPSLTTTAADHSSRDTTNTFRVPGPVVPSILNRAAHPFLIPAGIHPVMTYDRLLQHAPHLPHAPPHHPHSSLTLTSQANFQHHLLQQHARLAAAQQHSQHAHGLIAQAHAAAAAAPGGHAGHPSSRPPLPGQLTLPHDIHLERMDSTTTKQEPLSPDSDIADTHSPNLSSPLSNDGSEGSKGSGTSRRKKKDEVVPWWVKVENHEEFKSHLTANCKTDAQQRYWVDQRRRLKNCVESIEDFKRAAEIECKDEHEYREMQELRRKHKNRVESIEDFKRHAENYCNTEQEMKDMVELRRKIKNRDAAQRSRLKRMKSTDDLKQENIYLKREYGKSKKDLDTVNQIKRDRITRIEELERRKTKIARACKRLSANYSKDKNNIIHPRD